MTYEEWNNLSPEEQREEIQRWDMSDAELEAVNPLFMEFQMKLGERFGQPRLLPIMANLVGGWLSHAPLNGEGSSIFATVSRWLHIAHEQHGGPPCDLIIHGHGGYSEMYARKEKEQEQ